VATTRAHVRIQRSADEVWKVVSDAGSVATWFPGMESSAATDVGRTVVFAGGIEVSEEVVTSDDTLRRFQYRMLPNALGVEHYLGTIDVLEDGDASIVVYGADLLPDAFVDIIGPSLAKGVAALKAHCEG
jgi:hypothetical protein